MSTARRASGWRLAAAMLGGVALAARAALGADYSGRVLTPDGKPLKGARVIWVVYDDEGGAATTQPAPMTVQTDENGAFKFTNLANPNGQAIATAQGWGISTRSNRKRGDANEITLRRGCDVEVSFIDEAGKPAADVPVFPSSLMFPVPGQDYWEGAQIPVAARELFVQRTDAQGKCVFKGMPQGAQVLVNLLDERYAQLTYEDQFLVASAARMQSGPIRVSRGVSLFGKVTIEGSGEPVGGVRVNGNDRNNGIRQSAVTAKDGEYQLAQMRPGLYDITLDLNNDLEKQYTARARQGVTVAPGEGRFGLDFALITGALINGKVVAAEDGKGIANVPIGVMGPANPPNGGSVKSLQTAADGTFSARVPGGEQRVYVMMQDAPDGYMMPNNTNQTLSVEEGQTARVEFKFPRAAPSKIGKVLDPDDKPVAEALVYVESMGDRNANPSDRGTPWQPIHTDSDGTFKVPPRTARQTLKMRAQKDDLATGKAVAVGDAEVVLKLEKDAWASASGRVLDPDGKPLAGADVNFSQQWGRFGYGRNVGTTDAQGRYTATMLWPDGAYTINATAKGYSRKTSPQLKLSRATTAPVADLTLKKVDSEVAGVVVDEKGTPQDGATVHVSGQQTASGRTTTDAQGKFHFDVVSGDNLYVYVQLKDGRYISTRVKAGDKNISINTAAAQ